MEAGGVFEMKYQSMARKILAGGCMMVDVEKLSPKARDELWEAIIETLIQKGLLIADGEYISFTGAGMEALEQARMLFGHDEGERH